MVSAVSSSDSTQDIQQLFANIDNSVAAAQTQGSTPLSASTTSSTSNSAQLYSELQNLSQTDPTKFKTLTAQISKQLSDAASSATNPQQQQFLTNLSNQFNQASQTGSAASLQPPSGGQRVGGHHHHHGGGGHGGVSSSTSLLDTDTDPTDPFATTSTTATTSPTSTGVSAYQNTLASAASTQLQSLFANISQEVANATSASSL